MDVAFVVQVADGEHQLLEDTTRLALGEGAVLVDAVEEVAALGELEQEEDVVGVLDDAVALADVLVDELGHDGRLGAGSLGGTAALGRVHLADHLHGELLLGLDARAVVHGAGRTLANLLNHLNVVAHLEVCSETIR